MTLEPLLRDLLGEDLPIGIRAYDGTSLGPENPRATIVIKSPDALRRIFFAPGELGFSRAYVAGDIDVEGDVLAALEVRDRMPVPKLSTRQFLTVARMLGRSGLRPPPRPAEEARLRGRLHGRTRDAAAIAHHYDLSNDAYRLILGPSMTYSCAVFEHDDDSLEQAQANKHELVCRKLALAPGMRLLDIGCGWASMAIHAAQHHGVEVLAVTLSQNQADLARKRVVDAGVADRVDVRLQDYRDVPDDQFDAISSIGMFEHVGRSHAQAYMGKVHALLRPGGRFLNHCITRPWFRRALYNRANYISRYVFPDGDLLQLSTIVSTMQAVDLEVRHSENLRDHYTRTLKAWLDNLEAHWDEVVGLVGLNKARVWRLYIAASAFNFEANRIHVHQVLAVRPDNGRSGMPLRPDWDRDPLSNQQSHG